MDEVTLISSREMRGYTIEYYENPAYSCGRTGVHSFLMVYDTAVPIDSAKPLWVRIHGGGVGAYGADGIYVPPEAEIRNDQETEAYLGQIMLETGLLRMVASSPVGFRFLLPSMCDHDAYSGVGLPDPNNPNPEGAAGRYADGLLAAKAAIAYTRSRLATSHIFLHGTSSGSIGAFSVAYSLEREGQRISGAILDSHVLGSGISDNAELGCMPRPYPSELFQRKIGPLGSPSFYPEHLVASGQISFPIYHLWNQGDLSCCGSPLQTYTGADGADFQEEGCRHEHGAFGDAVRAQSPGGPGRSVSAQVCVNGSANTAIYPAPGACNLHAPTKYAFDDRSPSGDQLTSGGDYNRAIMDWVTLRLAEPAP